MLVCFQTLKILGVSYLFLAHFLLNVTDKLDFVINSVFIAYSCIATAVTSTIMFIF